MKTMTKLLYVTLTLSLFTVGGLLVVELATQGGQESTRSGAVGSTVRTGSRSPGISPAAIERVEARTLPLPIKSGAQRRYAFYLNADLRMPRKEGDPSPAALNFSAGGMLTTTITQASKSGYQSCASISDVAFSVSNGSDLEDDDALDPALAEKTRLALTRPFCFDVDATGRLKSLRLEDAVGEFVARYERLARGDYEKQKMHYRRLATDKGLVKPAEVASTKVSGKSRYQVTDNAQVVAVDALEQLQMNPSMMMAMHGSTRVTLKLVSTAHVPEQLTRLRQLANALSPMALTKVMTVKDNPKARHLKTLGDANLEQLMGQLSALKDDDDSRQARLTLMSQLTALLALKPAEVESVKKKLYEDLPAHQAATLIGALANAETPQAQGALAGLAADSVVDGEKRAMALGLLGLAKEPSGEATETAQRLMDDVDEDLGNTAKLAVGNMASALARAGDDRGNELVDTLIARYNAATSIEERALLIDALGNSGDAQVLSVVGAALQDPSEVIRR
ncbi:MAG: hypothetical protein JRH20_32290, partial [Deltaproteobacteria bacterium]|nr:hypothetical protein [Deltaproteobacteria bacterium]